MSTDLILDTLPPAALSVELDGSAAFTTSLSVTVSAIASEASEMQVRTDDTFDSEPFVPVAATTTALLPAGQCVALDCKTVCVRFRDDAGNTSAALCDTITFDSEPPAIPVITTLSQVTPNTTFALSLAAEPADNFFAGYEMVIDPADQGVFQSATATGNPPTFADLTLTGGPSAANLIRVRAIDQAGNRSTGGHRDHHRRRSRPARAGHHGGE